MAMMIVPVISLDAQLTNATQGTQEDTILDVNEYRLIMWISQEITEPAK